MRARILLAVAALVAGCAREDTPVVEPQVPRFSTAAPAPSGGAVPGRAVPGTCAELATPEEVGTILGTLITGEPRPVVGPPQAGTGRTARLDCYYGLRPGSPVATATVSIGVATYTGALAARHRLTDTIRTERDAGALVNEVPVGGGTGVLMRGRTWTLVAVRGSTTAVVTIRPNLVREDRAGAMLGQLADKALGPAATAPG